MSGPRSPLCDQILLVRGYVQEGLVLAPDLHQPLWSCVALQRLGDMVTRSSLEGCDAEYYTARKTNAQAVQGNQEHLVGRKG